MVINILPLVEGVTVDYHKKKKNITQDKVEGDIFSEYVLYYTECPSEGGIAGCGISLQYHPLLWWVGLRKAREKYHIYIYQ